jgi:uncharacterized membrane protein YedE/YeeE
MRPCRRVGHQPEAARRSPGARAPAHPARWRLYLAQAVSADIKIAALFVVGALLGLALYHAAFGFTSAWRVFIADGRGAGLRAQMLMLAVGVALFFPALAAGTCSAIPSPAWCRRPAPR